MVDIRHRLQGESIWTVVTDATVPFMLNSYTQGDTVEIQSRGWSGTRTVRLPGISTANTVAATTLTIAEQSVPGYDVNPWAGGTGAPVTISGTALDGSAAPILGAAVEVELRTADTDLQVMAWTGGAVSDGAGAWSVTVTAPKSKRLLRAVARSAAAPAVTATQTGQWACGYLVLGLGQSLMQRPLFSNDHDVGAGITTANPSCTVFYHDQNDGIGTQTFEAEIPGPGTPVDDSYAAVNDVVWEKFDAAVVFVDGAESGTSRVNLYDDAVAARSWADLEASLAPFRAAGTDVSLVHELWITSDGSTASDAARFLPFYTGRDAAGATVAIGSTVAGGSLDHILWDMDAAADAFGRGIFKQGRTKFSLAPGQTKGPGALSSYATYSEAGDGVQIADFRTALRDMIALAAFDPIRATVGPEPAVISTDGTHAKESDPDGERMTAMFIAEGAARAYGLSTAGEPEITAAAFASDGTQADLTVALNGAGVLTTPAAAYAAGLYAGTAAATYWTAPSAKTLPHHFDVGPFEVMREATAAWEPFVGTASVVDDGSGDGIGVIRLAPSVPFSVGDAVRFAYGLDDGRLYGNSVDLGAGEGVADTARRGILFRLVVVPASGLVGYGWPLRSSAAPIEAAANGMTGGPYVVATDQGGLLRKVANVPSGLAAMAFETDVVLSQPGATPHSLFEISGNYMFVRVNANGQIQLALKDTSGISVLGAAQINSAGDAFSFDIRHRIVWAFDMSAGKAWLYLDGALLFGPTGSGAATEIAMTAATTFPTNRYLSGLKMAGRMNRWSVWAKGAGFTLSGADLDAGGMINHAGAIGAPDSSFTPPAAGLNAPPAAWVAPVTAWVDG
jgi:hypothetical protein